MVVDGLEKELQFRVVSTFDYDCALGEDFLKKIKIVKDHVRRYWIEANGNAYKLEDKEDRVNSIKNMDFKVAGLQEFVEIQEGLKLLLNKLWEEKPMKIYELNKYKIDVGDQEPIKQRLKKYSPKILEIAHEQLDSYLEQSFVEPPSNPWCSPLVIDTRPNGLARFCIDFRKVNSVTKKGAYMLSYMDFILDQFRVAKMCFHT